MEKRQIILRQGQCPGDILTFTRALADFKLSYQDYAIDVRTPASQIFQNNPHITPIQLHVDDERKQGPGGFDGFITDKGVEIYDIGYPDINVSGTMGLHFTDAFRNDIETKVNSIPEMVKKWGTVKIKKTGYRPEIWISEEEKHWINQVETTFGWTGPFWLINAGYKHDNELKFYPYWQEVVDGLNDYFQDKVKVVQIGHRSHIHTKLKGVLDLVGKTELRQLIRLAWWSHGTIGPLSFQFVLSAALHQASVCVAAGKEGVPWHLYPHIRYLYTNGTMECCAWDGCWLGGAKGKCKTLDNGTPKCFKLIKPHMVVDSVKMYYEGGALDMNVRGK